ncbi:FAD-dependent oxidoreductase [Candidatus Micrarchaeota archaeon]|nr:FAD-dependent oxidoreductase [Candidatus Micrarchaeota archaeon]
MKTHDLMIVGCGPAGCAAALYAAREELDFVVLSKDLGGYANYVPDVESYLGMHYVSGYGLVSAFREHLKDYKVNVCEGCEVRKIEKKKDVFIATTSSGEYSARTVIVATGRRFRKLGVPGEDAYFEKGISYCAVCDGPVFRNKTVAVVGGGRAGLLSTMFLLPIARKIYLLEQGGQLGGTPKMRRAMKDKKVTTLLNTKVLEIRGDKLANQLVIETKGKRSTLPVGGIFIEIGYEPNTDFLPPEVKLNGRREIVINKDNESSLSGLFAAGDVTDVQEKQILVSAGEGAKSLLSALCYFEENCK